METTISALSDLKQLLEIIRDREMKKKVFVGFDGFVDKIKKAVKQKNTNQTIYFNTLREFADRIALATGKSGQVEMETQRLKLGGNAPILANTLGKLGIQSFCLGSTGFPERHPIFSTMSNRCEVIDVLNPGLSDAIEFADGKIIFSELSTFDGYDWAYIKKTIELERIKNLVKQSSLIAFVDWVNLPHASDIWSGFLEDVIKPSKRKDFLFLFDLCDPSKKCVNEIDEVLDLISCFSPYGKVTLGLNENETLKICASIKGIDFNNPVERKKIPALIEAGDSIYKSMNIDELLVHPIDRTIVFHGRVTIEIQGRLVRHPKVLTGGGDNLNAGYCLGLLEGLTTPACMLLGMAASGAYIENGISPDTNDIIRYIDIWIDDIRNRNENFNETPNKSLVANNIKNGL